MSKFRIIEKKYDDGDSYFIIEKKSLFDWKKIPKERGILFNGILDVIEQDNDVRFPEQSDAEEYLAAFEKGDQKFLGEIIRPVFSHRYYQKDGLWFYCPVYHTSSYNKTIRPEIFGDFESCKKQISEFKEKEKNLSYSKIVKEI